MSTKFFTLEDIEVLILRKFEAAHRVSQNRRLEVLTSALDVIRELQADE